MRTLFLQAPTYDGFDGGAGSRYQARREIKSFWYPTWLAQPAALVTNSRLIDAPRAPARSLRRWWLQARDFDLVVLHTSTPSFPVDVKTAAALKAANPALKIGLIGAKVAVDAEGSLKAAPMVDFVARNEFDVTIKEVADGREFSAVLGLSWRDRNGAIQHNAERPVMETMDDLPFVTKVYKRDLTIENYFIGYLKHPYISFYTGRGCKSHCTFCLWPHTVGGHRYRTRSVGHVIDEIRSRQIGVPAGEGVLLRRRHLHRRRAARRGDRHGSSASSASPGLHRQGQRAARHAEGAADNGLRLLLVGYESGNQQILHNIKKGMRIEVARRFTKDCHELGITIHGTFILGLPGETKETIEETIRYAKELNPHTSRSRWPRPIPARCCSSRRWRMAGSTTPMPSWSTSTACRSRRCTIRTCRTPRSSTRWRTSTGASISARRRSPRSSARWCARRR